MANRMLEEDPPRYTRASDPGEARLRGKDAPSSSLLCTDTDICDGFVGVKFEYMNAHQRCLLSALFQFRNNIKNTFVFMTLLRPYMWVKGRQSSTVSHIFYLHQNVFSHGVKQRRLLTSCSGKF